MLKYEITNSEQSRILAELNAKRNSEAQPAETEMS
jgi:hypothetical protein